MNIWGVTDKGVVRQQNQDDFHIELTQPDVALGIVCDGMGGARAGNVASRLAVDTFLDTARERSVDQWRADPEALLNFGAEQANQAVHFRAGIDAECRGMGTTMVAMVLKNGLAHIVHAGDSRAYLYRHGRLERLTRDHSMVQQLVDSGQITREQAAIHPQKNLITRALGVSANIVPEYNRCEIEEGDILLLCTDGLTNMVSDDDIAQVLREVPFFDATSILVDRALQAGGQDNITVLLMGVETTEVNNG